MAELFESLIEETFSLEGGYSNDPADSGGETNHGITVKVARQAGYMGSMFAMKKAEAVGIYKVLYWLPIHGASIAALSEPIASEVFDTGVNMGTGRAASFLQRSLNVLNNGGSFYEDIRVDGSIGARTITALGAFMRIREDLDGEVVLLRMLNSLQGAAYVELAERRQKDERFIFGWFKNRVVL